MKHCVSCGSDIPDGVEFCPGCGTNQIVSFDGGNAEGVTPEKYCVECGESINRKAEICPECGVRQPSAGRQTSSDQIAAGVLAILLGGIGVHKFYQGNTRNGVLYLCLFWTTIPAILGLIEGILILVADEEEYERKYADGSILGM